MKANKQYLVVASVALLLGIILAMTFKTVSSSLGRGVMPSQRAQQIALELNKEKELNAELKKVNDDLEAKIKEYEQSAASNNTYVNTLYSDASLYRSLAGYTDLVGEGVIIEITEPKSLIDISESLGISGNTDLLLKLISTLNAGGAEAISINDQRVTSFTEIERTGDYIVINGVPTNTPIVVKAIGDSDYLDSALRIKNGMVDQIRYFNYIVNVVKENNVVVPKTGKFRTFKYSKTVDEKKE